MGGHRLDPAVEAMIVEKIEASLRKAVPTLWAKPPADPLPAVREIVAAHSDQLEALGVTR
jgi:hypothetical protein